MFHGLTNPDRNGREFLQFISPEFHAEILEGFFDNLAVKGKPYTNECEVYLPHMRKKMWMSTIARPVISEGQVHSIRGVSQDITVWKVCDC